MNDLQLTREQKKEVVEAQDIISSYSKVTINTNADNEKASEVLKEVRARIKKLNNIRLTMTRPLDEAKSKIKALFDEPINKLEALDDKIVNMVRAFFNKMENERLEEERRIKAEQEKEALKLKAKAEKAEEKGEDEKADKLLDKAEALIDNKPVVESKVKKVGGVQNRVIWHARVKDKDQLPKWAMIPNEGLLEDIAKRDKEKASVPGVEFYSETILAVR